MIQPYTWSAAYCDCYISVWPFLYIQYPQAPANVYAPKLQSNINTSPKTWHYRNKTKVGKKHRDM